MGSDNGKARQKLPRWFLLGTLLLSAQLLVVYVTIRSIGISSASPRVRDSPLSSLPVSLRETLSSKLTEPRTDSYSASKPQIAASNRTDTPDGTFNNFPIYFKDGQHDPIHSSVQCVGESYNTLAWIHRSCKFRHFCFDTVAQDFVIYQSKEEQVLQDAMHNRGQFHDISNIMNVSVAIGGINTKWTWKSGVPRMEWFPKVIQGDLTEPYYELDPSVVWIPIHSLAGFNPGHLVWDDFLPIYTLMRIFQLYEGRQLMMMRYILKGPRMWATCDFTQSNQDLCNAMYKKFLPLMGMAADYFSTSEDFQFNVPKGKKSNLVCAAQGAAGVGMLTDHGKKLHGWEKTDYESVHNHGRGSLLFDFRNFMVANAGVALGPISPQGPYKITVSYSSSKSTMRGFNFAKQVEALKNGLGDMVQVTVVMLKDLSAKEQVQLTAETSIFISSCGGGAMTATFLPQGASVILYYPEKGGARNNKSTGLPALLDWDLFNNAAYIRAHWLPTSTMDEPGDLDILVKLVRHDLDLISHQIY